jgi:hypothetical protein
MSQSGATVHNATTHTHTLDEHVRETCARTLLRVYLVRCAWTQRDSGSSGALVATCSSFFCNNTRHTVF